MADSNNPPNTSASGPVIPYSLDDYFQSTPIGSVNRSIGNNLYGINHRQSPGMVPSNKDTYGLTFIVRPQLNLQLDNIVNQRLFYPLTIDGNVYSMQQFVRATLDPRLLHGYKYGKISRNAISCPLVDNLQAFIPVLTNNLNSMSGFPDITVQTHDSKPGAYKEVHSMVDDLSRNFEGFDLDLNFRNTSGDPILYLFYIWVHYASFVFENRLLPYPDYISENEIDYTTRIYRLVLDQSKRVVRKIAATGACFPVSVPTGSFFDFNNDKPYNYKNKDINIRFKCMGVDYQDDILIYEFNKTVCIFNPSMDDSYREASMVLLTRRLEPLFNNRGYPRINPGTNVLEWWVDQDLFKVRTQAFINQNITSEPQQPNADQFTG
jgi:hypothetical protein